MLLDGDRHVDGLLVLPVSSSESKKRFRLKMQALKKPGFSVELPESETARFGILYVNGAGSKLGLALCEHGLRELARQALAIADARPCGHPVHPPGKNIAFVDHSSGLAWSAQVACVHCQFDTKHPEVELDDAG
jgi:hypothetical protein